MNELQKAFDEHLVTCETCKEASSHRYACGEGKQLHEDMVLAAHQEHKDG